MSIEIYKALNREFVEKVQELKKENELVKKELVAANAKYFEENQLRMEEKRMTKILLYQLQRDINDALAFYNNETRRTRSTSANTPIAKKRCRSTGVTFKSPIRSFSPNTEVEGQTPDESPVTPTDFDQSPEKTVINNTENINSYGFEVIQEKSSGFELEENIVSDLSRLNLNNPPTDTVIRDISPQQTLRLNPLPVIQVTSDIDYESCQEPSDTSSLDKSATDDEPSGSYQYFLPTPTKNMSNTNMVESNLISTHSTPLQMHSTANEISTKDNSIDMSSVTRIDNSSSLQSSRPRRNRSQISYAELPLNAKLRNGSVTKVSQKKKRK